MNTTREETHVVPTQEGYDRWAEVYDAEDNPLVRLEAEHLPQLLGQVAGLNVVDLGCGTGRHAIRLAAAGAQVTAVDFSAAMLARARAKAGAGTVVFMQLDLEAPLPLPGAAFDRVLCSLVLDHIRDVNSFFAQMRRLCHANGVVVCSVMHPAMSLKGVQARFIEPGTGRRVGPVSYPHQIADYVMAGIGAGLVLEELAEYLVDERLAAQSARARQYLGWPMLLLLRWRRQALDQPCPAGV